MMASQPPNGTENAHLDATADIVTTITDKSENHGDPQDHLHAPANQEKAHSWFRAVFPYDSLEDFENQWHLGNYIVS